MNRALARRNAVIPVVVLAMSGAANAATAQAAEMPPRELAWVGLFNGELLSWLNNPNVMDERCKDPVGSEAWNACREEHMTPRVLVIPVRSAPGLEAARVGELVVVAHPGSELRVHVSTGGIAETFTPDLFLADWGYGPPYFHMTILARQDRWFRVPVPVIGAGWINGDEWRGESRLYPHVELLQVDGSVITTPLGDMVVLGVEDGILRARPEHESDMWCQPGDPPALTSWKEIGIPFEELLNSAGQLLVHYKYMKGC